MDHNRRHGSSSRNDSFRRSVTSPRHDPSTRISKSSRPADGKAAATKASKYMSQDEQSRQFVADEDKFVLRQSKKKADIRVREGRASPIDFIAFSLRFVDDDHDVLDDQEGDTSIAVPTAEAAMKDLNSSDLRQLKSDIDSYHVLETNAKNRQYWDAVKTLCKDFQAKRDPHRHGHRINSSVGEDIDRLLGPKNFEQLEELEKVVKHKLDTDESIDYDYWTELLHRLRVWKAKRVLSRVQEAVNIVRQEQQGDDTTLERPRQTPVGSSTSTSGGASTGTGKKAPEAPPLSASEAASKAAMALYEREAARGVSENEEVFAAEEQVTGELKPQWADKYQARKPRYFNRVQMGYDWNKYNQTHYDHDNPPPKVVQGYKFNVFYPDLIDVTKAPTFKIIREHGRRRGESLAAAGEDDTCLIRFIAGPPYEDIAFRIVDREWDYSAKRDRGFKSSFDKGILQLHFQFKKIFYRK